MKVRRMTPLLVTLPVITGLLGAPLAGSAGASVDRGSYAPMARGDNGDASAEDTKQAKQKPCPEDLWTVALPIEGLACVLLLPKEEPADEDKNQDQDQ